MAVNQAGSASQQSLNSGAARQLATTTKTVPQMIGITPRWFLRLLPWVQVDSGTYRVNRCKVMLHEVGPVDVNVSGDQAKIEPEDLRALALFQRLNDSMVEKLASKFTTEKYDSGDMIIKSGQPGDRLYIIVRGKVEVSETGRYGEKVERAILAEGDHFGEPALLEQIPATTSVQALTPCLLLTLQRAFFTELTNQDAGLRNDLEQIVQQRRAGNSLLLNGTGEKPIAVTAANMGEYDLPETFVDYEEDPREYGLSVVQTILRINTRVSDIYNNPHNQLGQQLRLSIEVVKEKQEWEMINNPNFGLLNNVAPSCSVQTRSGPPTPDDMDELLARVWKLPAFFLAHPRAIAAFGRECTRRGVPPPTVEIFGSPFLTWRGVPLVPTDKLKVNGSDTTNILLMRVGEKEQGVVGLRQTGIPDEYLPGLSVRFMSIDNKAIASYLISTYFSAAVLVDGAQAVPHFRVNVQAMNADFYVFSGHKLFGPTGIGVLYGKLNLLENMPPWQGGGSMIDIVTFEATTYNEVPYKFEAGTGHIAGAAGLGAAIDYLDQIDFESASLYEESLMAYATEAMAAIPGLRQIGTARHKAGVLSFVLDGADPEEVGKFLDQEGIAVRAGHHCAQPTMRRYGVTGTVRPSLAFYNTCEEIDSLVAAILKYKKIN